MSGKPPRQTYRIAFAFALALAVAHAVAFLALSFPKGTCFSSKSPTGYTNSENALKSIVGLEEGGNRRLPPLLL
jgi:hypothetical protein